MGLYTCNGSFSIIILSLVVVFYYHPLLTPS